MSGTVNYSISLEKQATWTIYKESPSSYYLSTIDYEIDNSSYEEYSYTGTKSQIDSQCTIELNRGGRSQQVQCTKTRLNGDLWSLKVRINAVRKKEDEDEEVTEEQQQAQENKWGSELAPRQTSVNISAIQQSILNHKKFDSVPPDNLAAIKMYMNGSGGGEKIGTSQGVLRLDNLMHIDDDLVQFAIKNPTYYVPSMTVTYSYWSSSKKTDLSSVAKPKDPPGVSVPEGYTSLSMGVSSSPLEKGYRVEETYLIGKFNKEVYEDN